MKYYLFVRLFVLTVFAVLIGVFARNLLDLLHYLVGGVMLLYGLEGLIFPLLKDRKNILKEYQTFLGVIELLLGIIMVTTIRDMTTICVMWGTWTIVRESYELFETSHKFMNKFPAILSFVLSIVEIVFSVLLIISAYEDYEHHALTHIYLLVPELIINAISPILYNLFEHKFQKIE